ncbi:MAG: patatin-like phospholipase family protein [Clostridia bacterium]|nr:patatin-like phospholipase family protein [Clostridia bacterium]
MAKKLGFALGSGGSRGVAHIGFLRAMEEEGIVPDFVSGCSMGAVVGSCYAKGYTTKYMEEIVKKLKFSDLLDLSLVPIKNGALLRSKKMQKKLQQYLGKTTFGELKIPFSCVATDLISGKVVVLGEKDKDVSLSVVASSSIPTVFKPVQIDDKLLVDGGVLCRVPIDTVRGMGAEVVVAIDVLGKIRKCDKKYNVFTIMTRTFDIADSELTRKTIKEKNPDLFIEPDLGDMSQYKFKEIDFAIQKGYEIGKAYAEKIKQLIAE